MKQFVLFLFLFPLLSLAQTANLNKGIILDGYDPVSYFKGGPLEGKKEIKTTKGEITYLFATEENRKEFEATPEKFTPAYEGWCATAVAGGYKYGIDPKNFQITNGRLFLFYKGWKGDAKKEWLKDEQGKLKTADVNWPKVKESKE